MPKWEDLPPIPPGFKLETAPRGLPPIPPGFKLDKPAAPTVPTGTMRAPADPRRSGVMARALGPTKAAFARGVGESIAPTIGGLAAMGPSAAIGATGGAALGSVVPFLGTAAGGAIGGLAGGVAGAMGGGYLVQRAQDYVIDKLPQRVQEFLGQDAETRAIDQAEHPIARFSGGVAAQLATMRPGAVSKVATLAGAGLGGGIEAGVEYAQDGTINPTKVAIAAGAGALLPRQNRLGDRINPRGAMPVVPSAVAPDTVATAGVPQVDPLQADIDTLARFGVDPKQFSTLDMIPGVAERLRANEARGGTPVRPGAINDLPAARVAPDIDALRAADARLETGLDTGAIDQAAAPRPPEFGRVLPDDVVIPVTPEGQGIDPRTAGPGLDAAMARQQASEANRVELGRAAADPVFDKIVAQIDAYDGRPKDARYNRLQALLDARLTRSPEPSGPADASVMRAPDQSAAEGARDGGYSFDPIGRPNADPADTGNMGVAENLDAPVQPRPAGTMGDGNGDSSRPFKTDPTDANGPAFEAAAEAKRRAAFDDMTAHFEAQQAANAEAARRAQAGARFNDERTADAGTNTDPSAAYKGKYGQRPYKADAGWTMTADGFIADKNGAPVAFRNHREAARFAADNDLGGDFDLAVWGAAKRGTNGRVVLKKRAMSAYGDTPPETPPPGGTRALPDQTGGRPREPLGAIRDEPAAPSRAPRAELAPETLPDGRPVAPVDPTMARAAPDDTAPAPTDAANAPRQRPGPNPFADRNGNPPKDGPGFLSYMKTILAAASKREGRPVRISLEDAVNWGVDPDLAKRIDLNGIFASSKMTRAQALKDIRPREETRFSLDQLGDNIDAERFGVTPEGGAGERLTPAEIARLLNDDPRDLTNPAVERRASYEEAQRDIDAFNARYGDDAAKLSDADLDAIDYAIADELHARLDAEAAEPSEWRKEYQNDDQPDGAREDAGARQPDEAARPGNRYPRTARPEPAGGRAGAGRAQDGEVGGRWGEQSADSFGRNARDDTGQTDAFGTINAERRAKLERDAQGPSRASKPQRDDAGPMFDDTARQTDWVDQAREKPAAKPNADPFDPNTLFSNPFFYPAAWKKIGAAMTNADKIGDDAGAAMRRVASVFGAPGSAVKRSLRALDRFGSSTLYSADSSLRSMAARLDAPTIAKLADEFHAPAGKGDRAVGVDFHEAVDRGIRTRTQRAYDALQPLMTDKEAMQKVRNKLTQPERHSRGTAPYLVATRAIRALLDETLEYRRAAGEDIGEVADGFFPRVLDAVRVMHDQPGFIKAATALYRERRIADPEAAAHAWALRVADTYAGIDGGMDHVTPGGKPNNAKAREFGQRADVLLRGFYQDDPFQTITAYLAGSVRRAEQVRRFGAKGRVGSTERAAWEKAHGSKTQWDVNVDAIKAELRASNGDVAGTLAKVERLRAANLGQIAPASIGVGRAVSLAHTWNQLSKMDHATVSSLGDLAMGFVRGGPQYGIGHLGASLNEFARRIVGASPSEMTRYAEAVGVANDAFATDLLRARAGEGHVQAGAGVVMDGFYRSIGLQQLTEAGRVAATKTGVRFLADLAADLASPTAGTAARAAHHLRELGVTDPAAFGKELLAAGAPSRDALLADNGFAARYGSALYRYVSQSILMPTRAQKPGWASHPVGGLFFALNSYSYGFKKQVLDRVYRSAIEAARQRDVALLAPASGLVVLAGLTYLNDTYLRPALFGSTHDFDSESPMATALRVGDRAGFLGALSPVVSAFKGLQYDRSLTDSAAGSIVGSAVAGVEAAAGLAIGNSASTNAAERKAAGALYDLAVEPAMDLAATRYLRGSARGAAILSTGNRAGGILPSDREAFIAAMAGAKGSPTDAGSADPWAARPLGDDVPSENPWK